MSLGKIRIDTQGNLVVRNYAIYLDDVNISKFVRGFTIDCEVGDVAQVTLRCIGALELPNELRTMINAELAKPVMDNNGLEDVTNTASINKEYKVAHRKEVPPICPDPGTMG
jgi:hypothetical protein